MTIQQCDRCGAKLPIVNPLHIREFVETVTGNFGISMRREIHVYYRVDGEEQDICKACLITSIFNGKEV